MTLAVICRVAVAEPTVTVAVRWTVAAVEPWAGRCTTPVVSMTEVSSDAHAIAVPWLPLVGRVMLPRTSSTSGMLMAAASASAFCWSPSAGRTVAWNVLVSLAEPRVNVAVSVTFAGSSVAEGRVTVPSLAMTAVLLDDQVTAEPRSPLVGSVRFAVTAERSPSDSAALSAATRSASDGASEVTSAAVNARS